MESSKKPYQCGICNKWYATPQTLQVHQKLHGETRNRNFPCSRSDCNKSFYTDQLREQHENTHNVKKEFQCDACSCLFKTLNYLRNHFNAVHSRTKSFQCEKCDKSFARKAELENHSRTHTGERPFKCQECHKAFNQRSNLQTHVRTTHKNEKRHQCPECPMSFKRRRLVIYHQFAKHKNEKPLKCTFCDKRFVYPQLFKKHMKICKSKPLTECVISTIPEDDNNMYLVNCDDLDFFIVNPDENLVTLNANAEQQNLPAIQSDFQKAHLGHQPSNNIQEKVIDSSFPLDNSLSLQASSSNDSSVLIEPNMEHQNRNEVFEVIFKNQDGHWYTFNCVDVYLSNNNETRRDLDDSTSAQELLQTEPNEIDIIDN